MVLTWLAKWVFYNIFYLTYYQRDRDVILNRAKDYYENDKKRLKEQARDKYKNLSEEEKN